MQLTPMTQEEFDSWAPKSQENYAKDKARANNLTASEAKAVAERDFLRLLPDGLKSKNNFLFSIRDNGNSVVGNLWLAIEGNAGREKGFVYDLFVNENHRRKGYGKKALLLAEQELIKIGIIELGLHVFAFNEPAIRLYKSLGYQTTDLVMAKELKR